MQESIFSTHMAKVLFLENSEKTSPERIKREKLAVKLFEQWCEKCTISQIHANCLKIDNWLIKRLSGNRLLKVAGIFTEKYPEIIDNMPILKSYNDKLKNANQLGEMLKPTNMRMIIAALIEEGKR